MLQRQKSKLIESFRCEGGPREPRGQLIEKDSRDQPFSHRLSFRKLLIFSLSSDTARFYIVFTFGPPNILPSTLRMVTCPQPVLGPRFAITSRNKSTMPCVDLDRGRSDPLSEVAWIMEGREMKRVLEQMSCGASCCGLRLRC